MFVWVEYLHLIRWIEGLLINIRTSKNLPIVDSLVTYRNVYFISFIYIAVSVEIPYVIIIVYE